MNLLDNWDKEEVKITKPKKVRLTRAQYLEVLLAGRGGYIRKVSIRKPRPKRIKD